MKFDPGDGLPMVGSNKSKVLGVRWSGDHADVDLDPPGDENGNVVVNRKGLSVNSDWRTLPSHLIPKELGDQFNGTGKGMKVYVHGSGPFEEGQVTPSLEILLKSDSVDSGVVRPAFPVSLRQYEADLHATRQDWVEDAS
jgi:hypothetical protein